MSERTTTAGDTSSTGGGGASFILPNDLGAAEPCSTFEQDCPAGQKCVPTTDFGDTTCVPLVPDPDGLYEPCSVVDVGVGVADTCAAHLVCWGVDSEGNGICWGQCIGDELHPDCADPDASCYFGRSALSLCIPACDPFAQDCSEGEACLPNPNGDGFACILDGSGSDGQVHDPCSFANGCDPGLLCGNINLSPDCPQDATGCCMPLCDTTAMPTSCPGVDPVCVPLYEPNPAPPGYENVGICSAPP